MSFFLAYIAELIPAATRSSSSAFALYKPLACYSGHGAGSPTQPFYVRCRAFFTECAGMIAMLSSAVAAAAAIRCVTAAGLCTDLWFRSFFNLELYELLRFADQGAANPRRSTFNVHVTKNTPQTPAACHR